MVGFGIGSLFYLKDYGKAKRLGDSAGAFFQFRFIRLNRYAVFLAKLPAISFGTVKILFIRMLKI